MSLAGSGCGTEDSSAGANGEDEFWLAPTSEEVYSLGRLDGQDWEVLGRVTDVAFAPDGGLYVLDESLMQVLVVDGAGRYLRTVGRKGGGPGELSAAVGLTVLPDGTLVVYDVTRGFHLFDENGRFQRTVAFDLASGRPDPKIASLPDGDVISRVRPSMWAAGSRVRQILRYSLTRGTTHPEYVAPTLRLGNESDDAVDTDQGFVLQLPAMRAFEPSIRFAVCPDGTIVVAESANYRVEIRESGRSGWRMLVIRDVPPLPVTAERQQKEIQRRLNRRAAELEAFAAGGGRDPVAIKAMAENLAKQMEFADVIPVITRLGVDHEGRIWVERYGSDVGLNGPTDVFDANGEYLGSVVSGYKLKSDNWLRTVGSVGV